MRYRVFRDHAGRVHRVECSQDEIVSGWKYWSGAVAVCVVFLVVTTIAAGLF